MKRFLLLAPAVVLAACGSSPVVPPQEAVSLPPLVYVSSARQPDDIASCLDDRLSRVQKSNENGVITLSVGSRSHAAYYVWLTPSRGGTVIKVVHPDGAPDDPAEEEMRFDIARCTT